LLMTVKVAALASAAVARTDVARRANTSRTMRLLTA
jgi:hypothetical protein